MVQVICWQISCFVLRHMLARMMLDCDSFQKWAMRLGDLMSFCTAWKAHLFLSFEAILICSGDFASRLVKFLTTLFSYWRSLSARLSSDDFIHAFTLFDRVHSSLFKFCPRRLRAGQRYSCPRPSARLAKRARLHSAGKFSPGF